MPIFIDGHDEDGEHWGEVHYKLSEVLDHDGNVTHFEFDRYELLPTLTEAEWEQMARKVNAYFRGLIAELMEDQRDE